MVPDGRHWTMVFLTPQKDPRRQCQTQQGRSFPIPPQKITHWSWFFPTSLCKDHSFGKTHFWFLVWTFFGKVFHPHWINGLELGSVWGEHQVLPFLAKIYTLNRSWNNWAFTLLDQDPLQVNDYEWEKEWDVLGGTDEIMVFWDWNFRFCVKWGPTPSWFGSGPLDQNPGLQIHISDWE